MSDKKHFVYLGYSGFPYGLAEVKKMTLIAKSLLLDGHKVTVIGQRGIHALTQYPDLKAEGNSEGIQYIYASGSPFRSDSFLKRNISKVKGTLNHFAILRRMKKANQLDYAIISSHEFISILFYVLLSKIYGFKTILNHVEYFSDAPFKWKSAGKWINDQLHDRLVPSMVDISFPISEFLIRHLQKTAPHKKYFKVPILAEFEKYDHTDILDEPPYFFFSGAAAHIEIIKFIIDSFNRLKNSTAHLYLAIKGEKFFLNEIEDYIRQTPAPEKIKLFSKLNEKQLYDYYQNAAALLIPLRPTVQDEARFPHKIGEYLASGNPVISTNYGEVKYYFTNMQTMLIADGYEENGFAEKMQFVIDHPEIAEQIGARGKELALKTFDYRTYGKKINRFLEGKTQNVIPQTIENVK